MARETESSPDEADVAVAVTVADGLFGWRLCPDCGRLSVPPGWRECWECVSFSTGTAEG